MAAQRNEVTIKDITAIWVWDPDRERVLWANEGGLAFWGEPSLLDLIERDFTASGEAARSFRRLLKSAQDSTDRSARARVVLAPSGTPQRMDCTASPIELPDGRTGLRIEAIPAPQGEDAQIDRMREIVDRMPVAVSLFAEDGTLLMQNQAAEQNFGDRALQGLGQRYGDRAAARNALRALLVNGAHSHTVDLLTRFGRRRHRVSMRRMQDPVTGGLTALVYFTDVSDRVESLMEGTARAVAAQAALLGALDLGAAVFDDMLKPLYLNAEARNLLGLPSDRSDAPLTSHFPEDAAMLEKAIARLRTDETARQRLQLAAVGRDGAARWLRIDLRRGAWRGASAWVASIIDMTEERRDQSASTSPAAIHSSAQPVASTGSSATQGAALDELGIGTLELDAEGQVLSATETAIALIGEATSSHRGANLAEMFGAPAMAALQQALSESNTPEVIVVEGQKPLTLAFASIPGGGKATAFIMPRPASAKGDPSGSLGHAEAIARASHELRTPLNAIIGFTEIMIDDPEPIRDDTYVQYLTDIHESGKYMARLVQDMLDLRRLEAGAMSLDEKPVNILNLVRRVSRELEPMAKAREVEITLSMDENLPSLSADAHTLRQAITNVMTNAVKFTSSPGWIRVVVGRRSNGAIQIDIADNGNGMDSDEIEQALAPFQQGTAVRREFGGAGMGMPLAKGFVQANGGRFEVQSEKEVGTTIRIVMPASKVLPDSVQ